MNAALRRLPFSAAAVLASVTFAQPFPTAETLRTREVAVDAGALTLAAAAQGRFTVRLFNDLDLPLIIENTWHTPGGIACSGRVEGDPLSAFSFAVTDGQVSATATINGRHAGLTPTGRTDGAGQALCTVQELAPGAAIRCAMAGAALQQSPAGRTHPSSPAAPAPAFGGPPPTGACDCHDDQSTVDLLVVYSAAAVTNAGGVAALSARVNDAVASANQAFIASGVTTGPGGAAVNRFTVRVVGVQPITYSEQPYPADWTQHLVRVSTPGDGFMDDVHAMRDAANADLVMLVVDDPNFTGGAAWYAVYSPDSAFSTLNWRAMGGGNLTLAHELGHNFGCAHDRGNSDWSPFRYAWGYWFTSGNPPHTYGDIMSYTGDGLPFYSNPLINDPATGHAMGTPLADPLATDNALTIAQTRWTLASYRDGTGIIDCNGNGIDDATDIGNGTSLDANGNCRPDECEYRVYVDASNMGGGAVDGLSWNTAWPSLADALAFAGMKCSNVSEVWVAAGTYKPDQGGETDFVGSRYATFNMRSGLAVIGGFQGKSRPGGGETAVNQRIPGAFPAILSGDIGVPGVDTDNSYNVVTANTTGANAVLDGFVIERGVQDSIGGGVYAIDSSITVRNCAFRNNRSAGGAGFMATGAASSPLLTGCTFENNTSTGAGGAIGANDGATVTVENSTIRNNAAAYGGAAYAYFGCALTLRGCTLQNNTAQNNGGAVDVYVASQVLAEDSTFDGNTTTGGGGGAVSLTNGCTLTLDRATLRNNSARWGGGVAMYNSSLNASRTVIELNHAVEGNGGGIDASGSLGPTLVNTAVRANTASNGGGGVSLANGQMTAVNCTIYGNTAGDSGGGVGMFDATLTVSNSILYANAVTQNAFYTPMDQQLTVFSGTRTVNRSCVQGLTGQLGGSGNIGGNPLLTNPSAGDLTPSAGSPCIDAGSNALVPAGVTLDLAGNPRFVDDPTMPDTGSGTAPIVDMGAIERAGPPSCPADLGVQGGLPGQDGRLDNNDFIAFISFFFAADSRADLGIQGGLPGHDGRYDNNDFIAFINLFFAGCE